MITIQEVQAKVKEIFPKLHEDCNFAYFELSEMLVLWIYRKGQLKTLHIMYDTDERCLLRQIDDLINETYKIYWG